MNIVEKNLLGFSSTKARSVCYYLSRQLKQAKLFKNYSKDPFVEADSSIPDEEIIAKTRELLSFIEAAERMTADQFDDATYSMWMKSIFEFEKSLSVSSRPTARVQEFLNRNV